MATARAVPPFLWFLGKAEEAIKLYVSLFLDGEILELTWYDAGEAKGLVRMARFAIGGKTVLGADHITEPAPTFASGDAFFIDCASKAELDFLFGPLADGGMVLARPGDIEIGRYFGWVIDRYRVSWQLYLS
jgi:predicted 3-demethylubiquinone-9 3-methyltransferase (glyoxalase superfamily)